MVQSFDPFLPIEDFPKKETRDSVGSINTDIIESVKDCLCSNKCKDELGNITLLMNDGSPMTGYCGHLFCSRCAYKLLYHEPESYVRPREIHAKVYEVAYVKGRILYHCKSCKKDIMHVGRECHNILRVFSENIMLRDLYKALKVGVGFHCEGCKEEHAHGIPAHRIFPAIFHPKFNSLHCLTCSTLTNEKKYYCVWHSGNHLTQNPKHDLKIMKPPYDQPESQPEVPGLTLSSLDRTQRKVFAALYHCACCLTSLAEDQCTKVIPVPRPYHRYLECGHVVGELCVKKAFEKIRKRMKALNDLNDARRDKVKDPAVDEDAEDLPEGLYCKFCKKDSVKKPAVGVWPRLTRIADSGPTHSALYDFLAVCNEDCEECEFTACKTLYSHSNQLVKEGRCECCTIVHLLRDCKINNEIPNKKKKK